MRSAVFLSAFVALISPAVCMALFYSTIGNEKLSAENYKEWPRLIYAINDPARVLLTWCNGDEHLSYSGDTASLNRVLKKFALTEAPELHVVLRPGPGQTVQMEGVQAPVDWSIHVTGGIARAFVEEEKIEAVADYHPTFTVFVTDRVDLSKLKIPRGVTLYQLEDLRRRYSDAQRDGSGRMRTQATRLLEQLDADADRRGKAAEEFQKRVVAIREFVERQREESATAQSASETAQGAEKPAQKAAGSKSEASSRKKR